MTGLTGSLGVSSTVTTAGGGVGIDLISSREHN